MSSSSSTERAASLRATLLACGAAPVDVPILQPAEPFLETAGEDLRRRIFLTQSEAGEHLCLRPEFTIPVCRNHIAEAAATPRRYGYCGMVFRQHRDGPAEFLQAGIEDLGDIDEPAADARAIEDALRLVAAGGAGDLSVTLGDQGVFEAVVAGLGLPAGWQKRLIHAFGNAAQLDQLLDRLAAPGGDKSYDGAVAALIAAGSEAELSAHIGAMMEAAGLSAHVGRSPAEIARRLKEKALLSRARLDPAALALLRDFLAMDVALDEAEGALRAFSAQGGLDLGAALAPFVARVTALGQRGIDPDRIRYKAAFGRPLDYYTGLVFEVKSAAGAVLAGGGRYDRLLTLLGAPLPIPGVGFSVWVDRLAASEAGR